MAKRTPGLTKVGEVWHIDKRVKGLGRLCESTGTSSIEEANRYLATRVAELRNSLIYGIRPARTFQDAAIKYLDENMHKRSINRDAYDLQALAPFINDLPLERVHMGTLETFIKTRLKTVTPSTVNRSLAIVRRILTLASRQWRHNDSDLTWLAVAPAIEFVKYPAGKSPRSPYPLSFAEERLLFSELPGHLAAMALFKVNTGLREKEVSGLRWNHEIKVPELKTSVFVIPAGMIKNAQDRLVVMNKIAASVVSSQRGISPSHVFTYKGKPITRIYNTAWKAARIRAADRYQDELGEPAPAGFRSIRVHDLKHTFGRRLRAAGVSFEDRQDLLGHKSGRITTHYSRAELGNLIEAAGRFLSRKTPEITLLNSRKSGLNG